MKSVNLLFTVCLLVLSFPLHATANNTDQTIADLIQTTQSLSLPQRIEKLSAVFLNQSYQLEPLGEGINGEYNQKPLYRLDAFDCETYVDTVIALALAKNLAMFQLWINHIRYKNGIVDFQHRNHFTSADWIPNNQKLGILKDLTTTIAGSGGQISTVYINRQNWYRHLPLARIEQPTLSHAERFRKWQQLRALGNKQQNIISKLTYVPLKTILNNPQIMNQIPSGALIFLVLKNPHAKRILGTENNISHMGFVIRKDNQLYLRAASIYAHAVFDVPLQPYLAAYLPYKMLQGISVWEVTLPRSSYFPTE